MARLLAFALCAASGLAEPTGAGGGPDRGGGGHYVRFPSWPATMLASRERYLAWRESSGMKLSDWYLAGPLASRSLKQGLPPEQDYLEGNIDLDAAGEEGKPVWRRMPDWTDGSLHPFPNGDNVTRYLYRTITVPRAMATTASLGSDDGVFVWLGGKRILSRDVTRGLAADQEKVALELAAGENRLLLKIRNGGGPTGFYFSVRHDPLEDIWRGVERDFPEEAGWMKKDAAGGHLAWFGSPGNTEIERAMTGRVIGEIGRPGDGLRKELDALSRERVPPGDRRWLVCYVRACRVREGLAAIGETRMEPLQRAIEHLARTFPSGYPGGQEYLARLAEYRERVSRIRDDLARGSEEVLETLPALTKEIGAFRREALFANPLLDFKDVVFLKKHFLPPNEGRGNHMCDQYFGFHAIRAGGLFVLEGAFGDEPRSREVLANSVCGNGRFKGRRLAAEPATGGFLSPDLSYDGKTILFAYADVAENPRRYTWNRDNCYHIFRVNVDGSELVQLTDGPWNDFDPCWLPNGRIVFISERRGGYGRCHGRPVPTFTLHTMEPDGSDITCISYHETNEWHPSVGNDGMILYTRWDYVDRGFNQAHHPWITTPDGRDARAIQGNYAENQGHRPHMEMDVRAIPGSRKYVATAAGHHAQAYGSLVVLDPEMEDDDRMAPLARLTPEVRFPESEISNREGQRFATAWPLSEDFHLCVHDPEGGTERGTRNRFGIYLIDSFGNRVPIFKDPDISCLSPIPLRPRKRPPVVPHATAVGRPRPGKSGAAGTPARELPDVAPVGVVNVYRSLRPFPEGTAIKSLRIVQVLPKSTPHANNPRIGYGDQKNARAVLGTVPVEADGSAYFELPVGTPVYFQVLDRDGLAVQSMRSDAYVHPGERLVCQGCHEPRHGAPEAPRVFPSAFRRAPSRIAPDVEGSNPFSFPRLVQPVLEANCVKCHSEEPKAPDLGKGDWQRNGNRWYTSYNNLRPYAFFFDNAVFTVPRTTPGKFGARASMLYRQLAKGHHDVLLSDEEMHRITLWLDCNSDFFGTYEDIEAQARGEVVRPKIR